MVANFSEADALFRENRLNELNADSMGRKFLKLRSLNRTEYLEKLFLYAGLSRPEVGARQLFELAFNANISSDIIEQCIRNIFQEERSQRLANEEVLINQLYKVQEFNWGGLHQNNLEQTIVDNYVKKITNYDNLCQNIEGDLLTSMRGYVICSWYNHWTSILIEDIFKDHEKVLPAVGLVKKIDFFVSDIPFDLKVAYLPEGYVADMRRASTLRPELTLLKQAARAHSLPFDRGMGNSTLLQDLMAKVADHPALECQQLVNDLMEFRNTLISNTRSNPEDLIRWLYENQGDRRFDASNRLFLILVDQRNYFESWKLKRAKARMKDGIVNYLNAFDNSSARHVSFSWEGETYETISDVIVITQS